MSTYRYQGSTVYTMDFQFRGQRIRESTGVRTKTLASRVERNRKAALEEGLAGVKKPDRDSHLFSKAAETWLALKKPSYGARSIKIRKEQLAHLLPVFGRQLLTEIEAVDVAEYQSLRQEEGAAANTIRGEIGTLRMVMIRGRQWARIQPDISIIRQPKSIGRKVLAEEKAALLEACAMSRSRSLLPFVGLAAETAARHGTLKHLLWENVDFLGRKLRFGKDKSDAGSYREIPLTQRAVAILEFWAANFPDRKPYHFVFPREYYARTPGRGQGIPFKTDPTKPMKEGMKGAWTTARKVAAQILAGDDSKDVPRINCRIHDLRHTGITRMLNNGVPINKIGEIVGWAPATCVKMATVYGHFGVEDLRSAVEHMSDVPGDLPGSTCGNRRQQTAINSTSKYPETPDSKVYRVIKSN